MTTKAEAFQDLAFLVSLLKEGHPEYRPSFDRLRDFINSVPEWQPIEDAIRAYDDELKICPLNSHDMRERQASEVVCQRCGADRQGACGIESGASYSLIKRVREFLPIHL